MDYPKRRPNARCMRCGDASHDIRLVHKPCLNTDDGCRGGYRSTVAPDDWAECLACGTIGLKDGKRCTTCSAVGWVFTRDKWDERKSVIVPED